MVHWIIYDITSDKKRNKIINLCEKMGMYRVQYSVFAGDINSTQLSSFIAQVNTLINKEKDSVYILPMCKKDYAEAHFLGQSFDKELIANKKKVMML